MKKLGFILMLLFVGILYPANIFAQSEQSKEPQYYKAEVIDIKESGEKKEFGLTNPYQKVEVKILDGDMAGKILTIEHGSGYSLDKNQLVNTGQLVVVTLGIGSRGTAEYQIVDAYRLDQINAIILLFFGAILLLSGWRGLGAIVGMFISLGVIIWYIVPQILAGRDPLFISISGGVCIMVMTMYLAHGFSRKTTISVISTFISLCITGVLAVAFVKLSYLTGLGTEDAYSLKLGPTQSINPKGLLLGGIIIGTLGVLDDVTTGLTASVSELIKANPKLSFSELFRSALEVGKEHIVSLVNTLVLAYAGAALPVFIILVLNPNHVPFWVILNSELIMEEVVRTLSGSIGLVAAVPITAFLASKFHSRISV